jgi:hypothetical protein
MPQGTYTPQLKDELITRLDHVARKFHPSLNFPAAFSIPFFQWEGAGRVGSDSAK